MRRNKSYSIQRINPNNNLIRNQSTVKLSERSRINYPVVGDSGFYGGVGRKHYEMSTQFLHKLILNPDYGKQAHSIQKSKSSDYLITNPLPIQYPQNIQGKKSLIKNEKDSLSKLQQQMDKKLKIENNPEKGMERQNSITIPKSQIITRKSSIYDPYANYPNNNSHFKVFGGVQNYYSAIHNGDNLPITKTNEQRQQYRRRFNPTYLSLGLGVL